MRELTMSQALGEALREAMQEDPRVFVMGEDIALHGGVFSVTRGLVDEFGPERVRNTPISESAIIGAAVGAALTGMRPVAELQYLDFSGTAMDPIVNQAAKLRFMSGGQASVPLVIRGQQGAGRGNAAQHSQSLEALFFHVPGLIVVQPATPYDAKGLLKAAIACDDPVIFIEHKMLYNLKSEVPDEPYTVPLGKARVARPGRDVTVVATAQMLGRALQAAEALAAEGIEAEVIDPRTLFPLDLETLCESAARTHRTVVVHEAVTRGGVGAEIASRITELVFDQLAAPVLRVGSLEIPVPYNPHLEQAMMPQAADIAAAVRQVCYAAGGNVRV